METDKKTSRPRKKKQGKVVNCDYLNVRSQPDLTSEVKIIIERNSVVDLHNDKNEGWWEITTRTGVRGFVITECIAVKE